MLDSTVKNRANLWEQRAREGAQEIEKEKVHSKHSEHKEKRNSLSITHVASDCLDRKNEALQLDALLSPRYKPMEKRNRSISFSEQKKDRHLLSPRKHTSPQPLQSSNSEPELSKIIEESFEEEKKVSVKEKKKEKKDKEKEIVTQNPLEAFKTDGHFKKLSIKAIKGLHTSKEHTLVALRTDTRSYELDVFLTDLLTDTAKKSLPSFSDLRDLENERKLFWLSIDGKSKINLLELFQNSVLIPESIKYVNALKKEFYDFKEIKKRKGTILSPLCDRLENFFNRLFKQVDPCPESIDVAGGEERKEIAKYSEFMHLNRTLSKDLKASQQIRHLFGKILPRSKSLLSYLQKWNIPETIPFNETSSDPILFHSMGPKSVKQSFFRYGEIVPNIYLNGRLLFKAGQKEDEFEATKTLFANLQENYKNEHFACYNSENKEDVLRAQIKLFMLLSDEDESANEKFKELFSQKHLDYVEIEKFFDQIEEFKTCPINWKNVLARKIKNTGLRPYAVLRQLIPAFGILQVTSVTSIYKVKDAWCKGLESEKEKYDLKFVNLEDKDYENTWKIRIARNQFFVKKLFQLGVYPMQHVSGIARPDKTTKLATFFLKFLVQSMNSKLFYTNGEIHCSRLELTPNAVKSNFNKIVASLIKHLPNLPKSKKPTPPMNIVLAE